MFKNELLLVPKSPGCYKMINRNNVIIYVGKAKRLQNRLRSYFTGRVTGKTAVMVSEVCRFEYIVTSSEMEAFILELNLIKEYSPKYNILLKDDKSYPYIELTNEKFPSLVVRREININKKNRKLYGPFPNVYACRRFVNIINRLYPLKKCKNMPSKICLYYHIGQCLGYCENKDVNIDNMKNEVISILSGKTDILLDKIKEKIEIFSKNMQYEDALYLKNEYDYLISSFEKQKVEINDGISRDIFSYYEKDGFISIEVFFLRNGKLVGNDFKIKPIISDSKNELEYFIVNHYSKNKILPKEVIVPENLDANVLSKVLNLKVFSVKKGQKKKLFDMCTENASVSYENNKKLINLNSDKNYNANLELKKLLDLDYLSRIEVFDNSNLSGTYTVAGMVVFVDGQASRKDYRKYKISINNNDDVYCMKEVIYRRYYRCLVDKLEFPDLIIVDGGINQINACKSILNDLHLNIKVCGIFKTSKHEASSLMNGDTLETYDIDKTSNLFHFITRISDEVHRFTIEYHKTIRSKGNIKSILDNAPKIGEVRKKKLIKTFGSVKKIKEASIDDLTKVLPLEVAVELYNYLRYNDKGEVNE